MPTYAYMCRDCGTALEVQQAFTDDALTVCPTCGGHLRKQYGSIGVTFNGSGFYRTDSRTAGDTASTPSTSDTAKPSSTESKPSGGESSKPAATPSAPSAPAAPSAG